MKIIDYYILSANEQSRLVQVVKDGIKIGWQPLGRADYNSNDELWYQTLVKYEGKE